MSEISVLPQSALEKVFPDQKTFAPACFSASALRGELFSYQLVVGCSGWGLQKAVWSLDSPIREHVRVFRVESVPCGLAAYPPPASDDDYLSHTAGLFPDLLRPVEEGELTISAFQNTTLWVDVRVPEDFPGGDCPLTFTFAQQGGNQVKSTFTLHIVPAVLPKQDLLFTQWFHLDCLASYYNVPVYSEEHWKLVEAFLREACDHGMNTVLTPVLSPPLDTAVGRERPRTQLLDISRENGVYTFGTERLLRFVRLAQKCGVTHFEISHLFTQWGAAFAPNIYITENGNTFRAFGWDTPADSPEYVAFLSQLLPAVIDFFDGLGMKDRLLFHISDEPGRDHLETYRKDMELVRSLTGGLPIIDALSDVDFYDQGLVEHPVTATNHIEPFLQRNVPGLWAYYCCSQGKDVGNRFLAMPSYRNRILGLQLYKFHIAGFLHWGYNFWYSQNSYGLIDPFRVTDGGGAFPGGDPFSVYPGEDGRPLPSLRLKVFLHGLQDLRALTLLERRKGREAAESCIPCYDALRFSAYPRDPPYLLRVREAVNRLIESDIK